MNIFIKLIVMVIFILCLFIAYQFGILKSKKPNYETTYKINDRYRNIFGSPNNQTEQILRDYIIYNDTTDINKIINLKEFNKILE